MMLQTIGLHRLFDAADGPVRAVDGVDLQIEAAEFVSVMGPSGCGKSTLLHLVGGLDRPSEGEIHLDGQRVDTLPERQWARLRRTTVGFVFQAFNLVSDLTVVDNLVLAGVLAGSPSSIARRRATDLLERLDLIDKVREAPGRLSGGQQQRVAIARAMMNRPRLLLADEPTGNLDSVSTGQVLGELRALHEQGTTIVLVTHDARVATAADRLLTMRDGRVVDETMLSGGTRHALSDLVDQP